MNKFCVTAIILGLACGNGEAAPPPTGREIMQKQKDLHESTSEFVEQNMVLVSKRGRKEVRKLRLYVQEVEEDVERILVVFLSPPDIRGTALLTWEHPDRDDDQWLYLPARGKMQRIAEGEKSNYFMGTDLTYEDLETENLDDYTYTLLKEEEWEGDPCYVVEAVSANPKKKSGYSKRVLWIIRAHYKIVKVEFYDRRGKRLKTLHNRDWVNVKGTMWRPQKTLIDNHKKERQTLVGVVTREVDLKIDPQMFTERLILRGKHVK